MTEPLHMPLARSAVDRDYLSRTRAGLFEELWNNPDTRVLAVYDGRVLLAGSAHEPSPKLKLVSVAEAPPTKLLAYLGKTTVATDDLKVGTPIVMAVLDSETASQLEPDEHGWHQLRRTGAGLSDLDAGLFAQGLALANWHETHLFCPACGSATDVEQGGWVRRCPSDNREIFPRTDPAIIVSVIDEQDRILLGSQGVWEENRWSILAGFVEPGESLTAAVIREMHEEAGVIVSEPKYLGSQAWPFPYSLMLGFSAKVADGSALLPDGIEIEKLRWFSRADIAAEAKDLLLPGRMTISRAMIEHWYGGEIISATEAN